jgi:putative FmdB family regulatory protein
MPTYEYVCKSCGHLFEIVQSMKDDPLTECPECAGELRKVFAPPAISFKGSGFYATDHGKKAKKSEATKESGDDSKKGSGGDSKDAAPTSSKGASSKGSETPSSSGSSSGGSSSGAPAGGTTTKKESAS